MSAAPIRNLDYVVLLCLKMAETRAFYLNVMQFPIELDRPNWVSFRVGAGLLTLRPRGVGVAGDDGPAIERSAAVQLAFRLPPPAIDAWHSRLAAQGVLTSGAKELPSWRHRALFFRDPEGNVIELYAEV